MWEAERGQYSEPRHSAGDDHVPGLKGLTAAPHELEDGLATACRRSILSRHRLHGFLELAKRWKDVEAA